MSITTRPPALRPLGPPALRPHGPLGKGNVRCISSQSSWAPFVCLEPDCHETTQSLSCLSLWEKFNFIRQATVEKDGITFDRFNFLPLFLDFRPLWRRAFLLRRRPVRRHSGHDRRGRVHKIFLPPGSKFYQIWFLSKKQKCAQHLWILVKPSNQTFSKEMYSLSQTRFFTSWKLMY